MKKSLYNVLIPYEDKYIVFNTLWNNAIVIFKSDIGKWGLDKCSDYSLLDSRIKKVLLSNNFYIDNKVDEKQIIDHILRKTDNDSGSFTLIIVPTLACNFSCWYCYEHHDNVGVMSSEDIENILSLIQKLGLDNEIKTLNIQFFGGEPTLCFKRVICPILKKIGYYQISDRKHLTIGMTTNGFLISNEMLDLFSKFESTFEITIDGNRIRHNKVRYSNTCKDTYDIILRNIKRALWHGIKIVFRFNVSEDTNLDIEQIFNDLGDISKFRDLITFSVQKVWQADPKINDVVDRIAEVIKSKNFRVMQAPDTTIFFTCYADKTNEIVVAPHGKIFKCTARDFCEKRVEGQLLSDGTVKWTKNHSMRQKAVPFNNSECMRCRIFPICAGRCSQKRLESVDNDHCIVHFNEAEKIKYAEHYLLSEIK